MKIRVNNSVFYVLSEYRLLNRYLNNLCFIRHKDVSCATINLKSKLTLPDTQIVLASCKNRHHTLSVQQLRSSKNDQRGNRGNRSGSHPLLPLFAKTSNCSRTACRFLWDTRKVVRFLFRKNNPSDNPYIEPVRIYHCRGCRYDWRTGIVRQISCCSDNSDRVGTDE